eukprot:s6765_g1.t1
MDDGAIFMPPSLETSVETSRGANARGGYAVPKAAPAPEVNQAVVPPRKTSDGEGHCCTRCDEEQEDAHYGEVCYSLLSYADDAECELHSISENFSAADPEDLPLLKHSLPEMLEQMFRCAQINDE